MPEPLDFEGAAASRLRVSRLPWREVFSLLHWPVVRGGRFCILTPSHPRRCWPKQAGHILSRLAVRQHRNLRHNLIQRGMVQGFMGTQAVIILHIAADGLLQLPGRSKYGTIAS